MALALSMVRDANPTTAYSSFLEWNPDPVIAGAAEKLYGHIDRLELYVGLQAEEAKPVVEGAGLCPGKSAQLYIVVVPY